MPIESNIGYTASREMSISASWNIQFPEAQYRYREIWSEEEVRRKRDAHAARMDRLSSLHIEDEESQLALYAQAISALHGYRGNLENIDRSPAFIYMTEPGGERFLIGDLHGKLDDEGKLFVIERIVIQEVFEEIEDMLNTISAIQHLNPGIPKVGSQSFEIAVEEFQAVNG